MESRSLLRALSTIPLAAGALVLASVRQTGTAQPVSEVQKQTIEEVRAAIRAAGGYPNGSVQVTATSVQLTVTIADPARIPATAPRRQLQARHIMSAISRVVVRRAELETVQTIHIDFVARSSDGNSTRIVDGVDFRKDPQGSFRHHIT